MRYLEGRVVVVTGGASGIGATTAEMLASAGALGAVLDTATPPSETRLPGWLALETDVRDVCSVKNSFATVASQLGRIDCVVASAGIVPPWSGTQQIDLETWEDVFAVNARGAMLTLSEGARHMSTGGGSMVAISSLNGWRGDPHIPSYVASKHAVVGLVRSMALDLGRYNIRVNTVAPGPVVTGALLKRMGSRAAAGGPPLAKALEEAAAETALRRLATVRDVANAVLFLLSELSAGITGQLLAVDGGLL
jgi:3alpha(or 20beta)-hydroxysteroid dehydrogenase